MTEIGVFYVCVSTDGQVLKGQQREHVPEASRRGWTIVRVYRERQAHKAKLPGVTSAC